MGPRTRHAEFVRNLNGYKILIKGNHDGSIAKMLNIGFNEVLEISEYKGWTLVHNPLGITGNAMCGHVHTSWKVHIDGNKHIVNVGVDQWDFKPISFEEAINAV